MALPNGGAKTLPNPAFLKYRKRRPELFWLIFGFIFSSQYLLSCCASVISKSCVHEAHASDKYSFISVSQV